MRFKTKAPSTIQTSVLDFITRTNEFEGVSRLVLINIVSAVDFERIHDEEISAEVSSHDMFYLDAFSQCIASYFDESGELSTAPEEITEDGMQSAKKLLNAAYRKNVKRQV